MQPTCDLTGLRYGNGVVILREDQDAHVKARSRPGDTARRLRAPPRAVQRNRLRDLDLQLPRDRALGINFQDPQVARVRDERVAIRKAIRAALNLEVQAAAELPDDALRRAIDLDDPPVAVI